MASAEVALDCKAILGESPVCDANGDVYFVDINGKSVHHFAPGSNSHSKVDVGELVGCIVPRSTGGLLAALEASIVPVDVASHRIEDALAALPSEDSLPNFRFNDGKCDPAGRLWAGTMNLSWRDPTLPKGKLYVLESGRPGLAVKLTEVGVSNGLAWSSDNRSFFFIDTAAQTVDCFDYELTSGDISNRRTIVSIPASEGQPDGMAIDSQDKLWVVLGESGTVRQYDPETGNEMMLIQLPVQRPTSCAFGGADLSELYVTTREEKGSNPSQCAGGLVRCHIPGVRGASHAVAYQG